MSKKFKIASALSTSGLIVSSLLPGTAFAAIPDVTSNINSLVDYLKSNQDATGKITGFGGETSWTIMGLAAIGSDPSTIENSGNSLLDFLAANPPADTATTGWERDLLAITAAGENPFTFGGRNYVDKVQSFANNSQIGSTSTLNDDIFGILALISAGSSANQQIISDSLDFVIVNQNADGGWSWSVGGASDSNDSAVAIEALKAAENAGFSNSGLTIAINDGVNYLLGLQQADGGWEYQSGFGTDGASTAWVIQAILGNDNEVGDGLNFLVSLQDSSGGVQYQTGFGADTFTSGYALSAFGKKAFPTGIFEGNIEEPQDDNQDEDKQETQDPVSTNQNRSDDDGEVLAAVSSKDGGDVLATTLPDTGISSNFSPVNISSDQSPINQKDAGGKFLGLFLALGSGLILVGFILRIVYGRISDYDIN